MAILFLKRKVQIGMYTRLPFVQKKKADENTCLYWIFVNSHKVSLEGYQETEYR